MSEPRVLLLGCGRARDRRIFPGQAYRTPGDTVFGPGLVTADINHAVQPDLWLDLNSAPPWYAYPKAGERPYQIAHLMEADYWDEIHAYEVLEHLSQQGDHGALLRQFAEVWRILKPNGYLCCTVPSRYSGWLWGDPSHRRVIVPQTLVFLDQSEYTRQCDGPHPTAMSDFRAIYQADFAKVEESDNRETYAFVLQAIKPSRYVEPNARGVSRG